MPDSTSESNIRAGRRGILAGFLVFSLFLFCPQPQAHAGILDSIGKVFDDAADQFSKDVKQLGRDLGISEDKKSDKKSAPQEKAQQPDQKSKQPAEPKMRSAAPKAEPAPQKAQKPAAEPDGKETNCNVSSGSSGGGGG